ncbi:hypothetical protein DMB66_14235 [Actinoplanes sp. ATCC 53533]|uniref:hypothetical protein n=1 Tax=Actinoplanes sp. ATCC 53533 TaxID=1288362 RepID=UPI000F76A63A|nr:hypothetical protein [Actinoplanes sp. ATCC 53533]RSM68069.1 hypothetical protein DMB66_14235 [Actinoplanes sp. ATCC 53533]
MAVAVASLADLAARLEKKIGNAASTSAISTRLILRTGVNLRQPRPEQANDPAVVEKVRVALADMGYVL